MLLPPCIKPRLDQMLFPCPLSPPPRPLSASLRLIFGKTIITIRKTLEAATPPPLAVTRGLDEVQSRDPKSTLLYPLATTNPSDPGGCVAVPRARAREVPALQAHRGRRNRHEDGQESDKTFPESAREGGWVGGWVGGLNVENELGTLILVAGKTF